MALPRQPPDSSRRKFLTSQFKWLAAATTAGLVIPLLRFTGFTVKPKPRYVIVNRKLTPGMSYTGHDFILFIFDSGPLAVSRRCTHLGCRVLFRKELDLIECPCHQSRFSPHGKRLSGPAQRDLPTFPVRTLEDESGTITGYEVKL